jgi:hypothetical protein
VDLKQWNGEDYYNTGVFVCSKEHRHIFKLTEKVKPLRNSFGEQTYLNLKLLSNPEVKIFGLPFQYNRMSMMDRLTGMTRLDSYIIHYAGDGDKLLEKMDRDIKRWETDKPDYKYRRQIFIWALGGLGDCVQTEPILRFIKKKVYPNDDVYVMTKDVCLYEHIEGIHLSEKYPPGEFDAVFEINTHQTPWDQFGKLVPFNYTHCQDWTALRSIGRQIPDKDKQIILNYSPADLKESTDIADRLDDLILVHPGTGWPTKTFPVAWWQKIVDDLAELGFRIGIIGKKVTDQHSVLDVKCPESGVDFREKLSIKGLVALISKARIVVTNDSSPIHIAGAFRNYIIFIATCKHPDYTLPYRNGGDKNWRAAALYKKILEDDDYVSATDIRGWTAKDFLPGHTIEEYIPNVEDVIDKVIDFDDQWEKSHCSTKQKENENGTKCLESSGNGCGVVESFKRGFRHDVLGSVVHSAQGPEGRSI